MNGLLLFIGDVGFGESEICKYLFENDLVEGIVVLLNDFFYNIGIVIYIWILMNNKVLFYKGKVCLVNVVDFLKKMKKLMGSKCNEIIEE